MEVFVGDITTLAVDVIVNAANEALMAGGGVCGAIHRAAGPELQEECFAVGDCPTGEARITKGYRLPAKHVIHAVGPVYRDGKRNEAKLLASAYRSCLALCEQHGLQSIAFPAISTGIYGYPKEEAATVAYSAVKEWLASHDLPAKVIFCCFPERDAQWYQNLMASG
jgi:O-acetyl-ADP-ribose deacetylase (regulator of RNase III)